MKIHFRLKQILDPAGMGEGAGVLGLIFACCVLFGLSLQHTLGAIIDPILVAFFVSTLY